MIEPIKKIVVCLDYTDKDQNLIENTCVLSKIINTAHIVFLYVIKDFNLPESLLKEFPNLLERAMNERKVEIENQVNNYFKCDISFEILIKQGSETKEILKVANEIDSDLLILGRKKESDSVLGARIARRSPCSLLIIPQNEKLKFNKIFIPVDFSDYSQLSFERTLLLTKNQKSKIYLHNVYNVPSSYRYSGKSYVEFAKIMRSHARNNLEIFIKKAKVKSQELIPVCTLDRNERMVNLIYSEVKKKNVDMIMMGAKGRSMASAIFIGSRSERMIRINNSIPLMIIRKKGAVVGILETLKDIKNQQLTP